MAVAVVLCCFQQSAVAQARKIWSCTVSEIALRPGEKIVGYTYNLQSAFISSVPKVAKDWDMTVYNGTSENPPWCSSLASRTEKLENAVPVSFFRDFVRVEMIDELQKTRPHDSVLIIYATNGLSRRRKFTTLRHDLKYTLVETCSAKDDDLIPKDVVVKARERICDFDLKVESAVISALPKTPRSWNESISIHISSDGKRRSELHGTMGDGEAALYPVDFRNLWMFQKLQATGIQTSPVKPTLTIGVADLSKTTELRSVTIPLTAVK